MNEQNSALVLGALDECIERYVETRRAQIDSFIHRHFSVEETFQIQKKSFLVDLFLNPLNALWSIPYLSLKKASETLDKMGYSQFTLAFDRIPSGIKTGYQKEIERLLSTEVFSCESLIKDIEDHPLLGQYFTSEQLSATSIKIRKELQGEIEKYSSSQAMISDLSSSLLTLGIGWIFFGDKTLGVLGLGDKIAQKMAHDKAASGFFLGKRLGSTFYHAFPPHPSRSQVLGATLVVGLFLTALSLFTSIMSDPLRKQLGLHNKRLNVLADSLEEKLFLNLRKDFKKSTKCTLHVAEAG
ncbi:DUF6635 family protein [Bdellovibrio svalbardensis]|uniref:Uncharacterized protein n=1 Tax=Bdellovibrio svalbardensis TaxID=2972972 RepID=A0ABT6DP88_9BACT|nr:DUF6635 family protein [Bdellovibrio svalbardensis]MDG0817651.1 hypothetical protein [Bdellovibrio svalbardensis]